MLSPSSARNFPNCLISCFASITSAASFLTVQIPDHLLPVIAQRHQLRHQTVQRRKQLLAAGRARPGNVADIRPLTGDGINPALDLQLSVGALHGVGIDCQLHRHLPYRWKLLSLRQNTGQDFLPDLLHNLHVNRPGISVIQLHDVTVQFSNVYYPY